MPWTDTLSVLNIVLKLKSCDQFRQLISFEFSLILSMHKLFHFNILSSHYFTFPFFAHHNESHHMLLCLSSLPSQSSLTKVIQTIPCYAKLWLPWQPQGLTLKKSFCQNPLCLELIYLVCCILK